ncbi:MAG: hypothetical protein V2A77_06650 [Pseudomonadota bacterium]
MKNRIWAAAILALILLFWAFVLATPVLSGRHAYSRYAVVVADNFGLLVPVR